MFAKSWELTFPRGMARLALRRAVDHFAKKPIEAEEILIGLRAFLLELLEPLRKDFLEQSAVDGIKELSGRRS